MQGLGGALCRRFKAIIRRELHKFQVGSCDLIMLQEHHLDASKIQSYGNMLRGDWRYYWIPACGQSENKCGVCMILSDKWYTICSSFPTSGRRKSPLSTP